MNSRWSRHSWILLPLAAMIFFMVPLVRGQVLVPADILNVTDSAWSTSTMVHNPLLSDVLFQFYPWQKFLFDQLHHGVVPLWNPAQLTGTPFLANDQTAIFDPVRLASFVVGLSAANSFLVMAILRLALFGVFTWLFLRRRGFDRRVALIAGGVAMFSAPAVAWLSYPLFATFLWLPLLLYGVDVLREKRWRGLIILAAGTAAQFFSGNIQISAFILGVTIISVLIVWQKTWLRTLLWTVAGIALGTMIASVQLLPTMSFIRQSGVYETGRSGYATASLTSAITSGKWLGWTSLHAIRLNLEKVIPLVAPEAFGNPAHGTYRFVAQDLGNNYNELASSIGIVGLILALFGLINFWRERLVRWAAIVGGVCLLVIMHAPIFELVNYVPWIKQTDTERLRFVIMFCSVILAAYGIRAVFEGWNSRRRTWLFGLSATILLVVEALTWRYVPHSARAMSLELVGCTAALFFVAVIRRWSRGWQTILVVVALLFGPVVSLWGYNTAVAPSTVYPSNAVVAAVRAQTGTMYRAAALSMGSKTPLRPNSGLVSGINDIRGYEVVRLKSFDDLTTNLFHRNGSTILGVAGYSPLLDAMSVKTVVMPESDATHAAQQFLDHGWSRQNVGAMVLLINPNTLPRVYVAKNDAAATVPTISPAIITAETANSLTISADAQFPGLLVNTDAYSSDWQATVDGNSVTIQRYAVAQRAIPIPAGRHTVILQYRPQTFTAGAIISLTGLIILLGLMTIETSRTALRRARQQAV